LVAQLKTIQARLSATALTILRGDGVSALKQISPATMDVVFLDPPFDAGLCEAAMAAAARAIKPGGYVYLETPTAWTDEALAPFGLKASRHLKAGAVHAHLLTPVGSNAA
jgi:16S rRNA G966 N2-methylase RsmD